MLFAICAKDVLQSPCEAPAVVQKCRCTPDYDLEKGMALFSPGKFSAILIHSKAMLPKPGTEGRNGILCRSTLSLAQLQPLKWRGSRMVPKRHLRGRISGGKSTAQRPTL